MSNRTKEMAESLRRHFTGPMTSEEIDFLRDIQGFLDFGIRNGLSFPMVAAALGHDLNELARAMYSLKETTARGFVPKVSGYSQLSPDDFGSSADESE